MRRSYKFRLYPSNQEEQLLSSTLETCRCLYNNALAERKNIWKVEQRSITYSEQANKLAANKDEYQSRVYSQVLQDVLRRLKKSFSAFFRRVKAGEKPGYPRFKGQGRYDSFTYPQSGFSFADNGKRVNLSKIGSVRIKLHRLVEGIIKTCTIQRDVDQWYVVFSCKLKAKEVQNTNHSVGIDVGLETFATLSDGTRFDNPRFLRSSEQKLTPLHQELSRKKKGSNRRHKAKHKLAKAY